MILMPSTKKYLKFSNWQNTLKHNFICFADIESNMEYNDNKYDHKHLLSGYYLDCVDKRYSKKVQLFNKIEDFRDSLISELDYIEKINKTILFILLAIYLAHLLLHQGRSWLTALATYGFIYLSFLE